MVSGSNSSQRRVVQAIAVYGGVVVEDEAHARAAECEEACLDIIRDKHVCTYGNSANDRSLPPTITRLKIRPCSDSAQHSNTMIHLLLLSEIRVVKKARSKWNVQRRKLCNRARLDGSNIFQLHGTKASVRAGVDNLCGWAQTN